jgi:hypothetical protein
VTRRFLTLLVAGSVSVSMVACGPEEGIGERASAALVPHVHDVRSAVSRSDRQGALDELGELRQAVAELQRAGELNEPEAARVLQAAVNVERSLLLLPAPTHGGGVDRGEDDTEADEAEKQAEEEAKKRAEEARKQAEEARKRADDAKKE